ncbi:MAG: radical SAM family heme chaperone HemW [Candidatus Borkfalkiaceae bacterium]|nr:radical SAM family heme chaperone HemW [Christensenellaceae bacterium]
MAGIYVHVPFCKQKCTYCDFASYPKEIGKAEAYFACMLKEINSRAQELKGKTFNTVYFGGGTPSFVSAGYIAAIMKKLNERFDIEKGAEITLELNPGTIDEEKVSVYKQAGINRFSIGLQSAYDKRLLSLNRIHTADDFKKACALLKGENFSADVMIGLEDQKEQEVKDTIDLAVNCGAKHISVYALKPEEGTPMFGKYLNGDLLSEDETADLYDFARGYLKTLGFERYEVSNFALPGYRSRHNLNYWKRGEYVGFGVAASSCINNRRFTNTESIDEYVHCLLHDKYAEVFSEQIEGDEIISEYIMLALRTSDGIDLADYLKNFGSDFKEDFKFELNKESKYLDISDTRVKIKDEYLFVQNNVIINFLK